MFTFLSSRVVTMRERKFKCEFMWKNIVLKKSCKKKFLHTNKQLYKFANYKEKNKQSEYTKKTYYDTNIHTK
jgi:hypothetical protein